MLSGCDHTPEMVGWQYLDRWVFLKVLKIHHCFQYDLEYFGVHQNHRKHLCRVLVCVGILWDTLVLGSKIHWNPNNSDCHNPWAGNPVLGYSKSWDLGIWTLLDKIISSISYTACAVSDLSMEIQVVMACNVFQLNNLPLVWQLFEATTAVLNASGHRYAV